jgi:hypothetical protein
VKDFFLNSPVLCGLPGDTAILSSTVAARYLR